jgi:nucleotide-binding universal stress UspA family protein
VVDRTDEIRLEIGYAMGTSNHRMRTVVVGIDGTADGMRALRFAVEEAGRPDACLRIVHVQLEGYPGSPSPSMPALPESSWHEIAAGLVKEAEEEARRFGYTDPHLETVLASGTRRHGLLEQLHDADCLVLGTRTAPLEHLVAGSTTTSLAAHADVPVIAVPHTWDPAEPYGRVVVGADAPELSHVVAVACDAARDRRAHLEVLHAWRPMSPYDTAIGNRVLADTWGAAVRTALAQAIRDTDTGYGIDWEVTAHYERPLTALHDASKAADLLVVGRHGHSAPHGFTLGSVARALIRTAHCPVMVVPTTRRGE